MTEEQVLENILESAAAHAKGGHLGLLDAALEAYERIQEARLKIMEAKAKAPNTAIPKLLSQLEIIETLLRSADYAAGYKNVVALIEQLQA